MENNWVPFWWVTVWKAAAPIIAMLKSLGLVTFGGSLSLDSSVRFVLTRFVGRFNILVTFGIGTSSLLELLTGSFSSGSGFGGSSTFGDPKWEHRPGTKMRLSNFMSRTTPCRLSQGFPRIMGCCPSGVINIGAVSSEWSWTVKPG